MECVRCFIEKDCSSFYANDRTCKKCRCFLVRENRKENIEHYREFDRQRNMLPHRVSARAAYQKTDAGRASVAKSKKKWLESNADKRAAHVILGNAVRSGRINKLDNCPICWKIGVRIHGHHDDYAKPLEVRWCCSKCHRKIHDDSV